MAPAGGRLIAEDSNRSHDWAASTEPRIVILWSAMGADDSLPDDVATLKAMLRAERAARLAAERGSPGADDC